MPKRPADPAAARRTPSSTRTVERALGLLAEVCSARALSLADCARRVNLSPSTALRLLRTLENAEFVARDARGFFHAGPRLIQLGAAALGRESLARLAEPSLRRVVAASGESAYVCVPGPGDTALCVGMVEGTHAVRHAGRVGQTVPLDGTAVGRALIGDVPEAGYVVRVSGAEDGVVSVAAPIPGPGGGVAGALALVGPAHRIGGERARAYGALAALEARAVAARYAVDSSSAPARAGDGAGHADGPESVGGVVQAVGVMTVGGAGSAEDAGNVGHTEHTGNAEHAGNTEHAGSAGNAVNTEHAENPEPAQGPDSVDGAHSADGGRDAGGASSASSAEDPGSAPAAAHPADVEVATG